MIMIRAGIYEIVHLVVEHCKSNLKPLEWG